MERPRSWWHSLSNREMTIRMWTISDECRFAYFANWIEGTCYERGRYRSFIAIYSGKHEKVEFDDTRTVADWCQLINSSHRRRDASSPPSLPVLFTQSQAEQANAMTNSAWQYHCSYEYHDFLPTNPSKYTIYRYNRNNQSDFIYVPNSNTRWPRKSAQFSRFRRKCFNCSECVRSPQYSFRFLFGRTAHVTQIHSSVLVKFYLITFTNHFK